MTDLKLYNTLTRQKENFKPLDVNKKGKGQEVGLYTCGPTVYNFAHIGNLRSYLFEDVLKRVLFYNGFKVNHIMNITDVGHLTSDADTGEDKLEKGAKRENKSVWEIAEFYTKAFKKDLALLNIEAPSKWIKATDTIKEQIAFIELLEQNGYTYSIGDGVYFDTSKLKNYGVLWGNKKEVSLEAGKRVEMVKGKKNPTDFALWKLSPKEEIRQMEWSSPWGVGFPGWHTECVVMAEKELGSPFDIHCGGIDHIQVHHTNEIAQAQGAFSNNLANFWLHGEFLDLGGEKMSKSTGGFITLQTLIEKGFTPLSYRYLCLQAHYRTKLNFSFEALKAAENGLTNLIKKIKELKQATLLKKKKNSQKANLTVIASFRGSFIEAINDDLNIPKALALLFKVLDDKTLSPAQKYALALDFDKVFGLKLKELTEKKTKENKKIKIPLKVKELLEKREALRRAKQFTQADVLREQIEALGWLVEDTADGFSLKRK
ncbi:MAG: cysteine--tRNA ligase [bacterium]|nr:cysteine--tRNA ligase [bacterium]